MKIIPVAAFLVLMLLIPINSSAQMEGDPRKLIDVLGRTAEVYFLSANRPFYGTSAYVLDKGESSIELAPYFSEGNVAVPVTYSYGISNRFQVFAGMDLHSYTYRFDGSVASGLGDANLGAAYMFQNSAKFSHVVQALIKIPTASKSQQIGTGYVDYYLGLAQGFTTKGFSYELAVDFSMLHRRDLPGANRNLKIFPQSLVDSMKTYFDYKFEPEFSATLSPSVEFSDKFDMYAGVYFTRNTKLKYNSTGAFFGFGYNPSHVFGVSADVSKGMEKAGALVGSIGLTFTFK